MYRVTSGKCNCANDHSELKYFGKTPEKNIFEHTLSLPLHVIGYTITQQRIILSKACPIQEPSPDWFRILIHTYPGEISSTLHIGIKKKQEKEKKNIIQSQTLKKLKIKPKGKE